MDNIKSALEYLNRDYIINASIIEPIKNGTVDVLYASDNCVMVKDKLSDVYMLQTEDLALADKLLGDVSLDVPLVAHNKALADFAIKKLGYNSSTPCYQGVYRKQPFALQPSELTIRPMRKEEAEEASVMYGFSVESAIKHIELGLVYGGYVGDQTSAMIGMHYQGSMGLLEVKENFRRRGYAEVLEKFLINSLLQKNLVPYCQIVEGNEASLSLQRKLGLDISTNMLYWLHKENEPCADLTDSED